MAFILAGAPVAESIRQEAAEIARPLIDRGMPPSLCLIRANDDPAAVSYERSLVKAASKLGFDTVPVRLSASSDDSDIIEAVQDADMDTAIDGIMVLAPLPKGVDAHLIADAIYPAKDVDGASPSSLMGVFTGSHTGFAPATAEAVVRILDFYDIPVEGRRVAVLGRSLVVGKPAAMMLLERNATVTLCHSRTHDLPRILRDAEIIVSAVGSPGFITSEMLSAGDGTDLHEDAFGKVVIDVGVNEGPGGSLCGDVDSEGVMPYVKAITPVPGGVGAVVTALLMLHCAIAAESRRG